MKCEVTKLEIGEECNVVIPLREFVKARDDKSEMRYLSELTHMYMAVHDISIFMYDDWYAGILSWFDDTMLDSVDIVFAVVEYDWVYYFYVYDNREDKYHMLFRLLGFIISMGKGSYIRAFFVYILINKDFLTLYIVK